MGSPSHHIKKLSRRWWRMKHTYNRWTHRFKGAIRLCATVLNVAFNLLLNLDSDFGLNLIAAATLSDRRNILKLNRKGYKLIPADKYADTVVNKSDQRTCYGSRKGYRSLFRHINS